MDMDLTLLEMELPILEFANCEDLGTVVTVIIENMFYYWRSTT
jgi:hypothetical protein